VAMAHAGASVFVFLLCVDVVAVNGITLVVVVVQGRAAMGKLERGDSEAKTA
jgi:hypothetical protein